MQRQSAAARNAARAGGELKSWLANRRNGLTKTRAEGASAKGEAKSRCENGSAAKIGGGSACRGGGGAAAAAAAFFGGAGSLCIK